MSTFKIIIINLKPDLMELERFDSFVEDLLAEKSERPIIIIGASKIEELLLLILSKYLITPFQKEDMFDGHNPLATFSSRVKMSYRLGLIDEDMHSILNRVRQIRNDCAHGIKINIRSSPIRDHLNDIKVKLKPRSSYKLTCKRFFEERVLDGVQELQCLLIAICVILELILKATIKTMGVPETLSICKK